MNKGTLKAVAGWALSRLGAGESHDCAMYRLRDACHDAVEFTPDDVQTQRPHCQPDRREAASSQPPVAPADLFSEIEDGDIIQAAVLVRRESCSHDFLDGRCVWCGKAAE